MGRTRANALASPTQNHISYALLFECVAFSELVHTSFRIEHCLMTGIERMTCRTRVHGHLFDRGSRICHMTTNACDGSFSVIWMDVLLHKNPFFKNGCISYQNLYPLDKPNLYPS